MIDGLVLCAITILLVIPIAPDWLDFLVSPGKKDFVLSGILSTKACSEKKMDSAVGPKSFCRTKKENPYSNFNIDILY